MMDPASGGGYGENFVERLSRREGEATEEWLTESQIGGPLYLNSPELAKVMVASLPSKPHKNAALAAKGIKVYKYEHSKKRTIDRIDEGAKAGLKVFQNFDSSIRKYHFTKHCLLSYMVNIHTPINTSSGHHHPPSTEPRGGSHICYGFCNSFFIFVLGHRKNIRGPGPGPRAQAPGPGPQASGPGPRARTHVIRSV